MIVTSGKLNELSNFIRSSEWTQSSPLSYSAASNTISVPVSYDHPAYWLVDVLVMKIMVGNGAKVFFFCSLSFAWTLKLD